MKNNYDKIYAINHYNFIDKIVFKKRLEISNIITSDQNIEHFPKCYEIHRERTKFKQIHNKKNPRHEIVQQSFFTKQVQKEIDATKHFRFEVLDGPIAMSVCPPKENNNNKQK